MTIEKLAVMFYIYSSILTGILTFFTLIFLLFTKYYWITVGYLIWLKLDGNTEEEVTTVLR
jgi:hypothetical protein